MHILLLVEEASERSQSFARLPSRAPGLSVRRLEGLTNEMATEGGFSKLPDTSHSFSTLEEGLRFHAIGSRLEFVHSVDAVPVKDILPATHQHL